MDDGAEELLERLQAQVGANGADREGLLRLVRQLKAETQTATDWCEAAGQSEPLTTRLKNLLKDYPADVGLFKEMVQNADDAGATKVHFVWDQRLHKTSSLLTPEMARWQGSSLWSYNDAIFTEQDFEAICRLGVGGKRRATQRIGRFGLGFNSVYNLTDLPSIISDDVVLFLDPHVCNLQAMGASTQKPGIKLRFLKIDVLAKFPDQFEPYHHLLGCDLKSSQPFKGTLIRIPFRTAETARNSEISNIVVDDAMMTALIQQFQAEAFQWLLFLQNVREITMSRLRETRADGTPLLESLGSVSLGRGEQHGPRPSIVTCKANAFWGAAAAGVGALPSFVTATLDVTVDHGASTDTDAEVSDSKSEASLRRYHLFTDTRHSFTSRVCLAVPLARDRDAVADSSRHNEEGRVFCFLPVPRSVDLGLRVHVHAPLNMAQDRRSMLLDDRIGESERELVRHNFELLDKLIPRALLACLTDLAVRKNQTAPARFFALFPVLTGRGAATAPSERVARTFYARLISGGKSADEGPCPPLPVAGAPAAAAGSSASAASTGLMRLEAPPSHWVTFAEAIFVPLVNSSRSTDGSGSQTTGSVARTPQTLIDEVVQQLLRFGVPLVDAPAQVLESIERAMHPKHAVVLTPRWLREFLRKQAEGHTVLPIKSESGSQAHGVFAEMTAEDVTNLLEFALSDGDTADLAGVPLLLCEDEDVVQVFRREKGGMPVFVPDGASERRLFPKSREGKRCCLASRLEKRPIVWAQLREMAQSHQQKAEGRPSFQCRLIDFQLLIEALQRLLPKTWNERNISVSQHDWSDWVEGWLQALWRWLDLKNIAMSRMAHWPIIPSMGTPGGPTRLHRVPEPHRHILFSGVHRASATQSGASDPPPPPPPHGASLNRNATSVAMTELLEQKLQCVAVYEPSWMLQHHEKQYRSLVHAGTAEGFLKAMHVVFRVNEQAIKRAAERRASNPSGGATSQTSNAGSGTKSLREMLGDRLSVDHVRALVSTAALSERGGCSCESASGATWKCRCEVIRSLPLFCSFNLPDSSVALLDADVQPREEGLPAKGWALLPEVCPEVVLALRAAGVALPAAVEIPPKVVEGLTAAETNMIASLLRELALPRLRWATVLLDHVFHWAQQSKDLASCQGLMLALVARWREMELSGNDECIEALQHVPFVSTVSGTVLCPKQVLDPTVDELHSLYGTTGSVGPFPDARFLSVECRAVLKYRKELNCQELCDRVMFLHESEVERRESAPDGKSEQVSDELRLISEALVRYIIDHVAPLIATLRDESETTPIAPTQTRAVIPPPPPPPPPKRESTSNFWSGLTGFAGMLGVPFEAASTAASSLTMSPSSNSDGSGQARQPAKLSADELRSIQSKLQCSFWLSVVPAPGSWPPSAPWGGRGCGFCSPKEVRLATEETLVGMVRPLVGLNAALPRGAFKFNPASRAAPGDAGADVAPPEVVARPAAPLPRFFLEMLELQERPGSALIHEQLKCLEAWAGKLEESELSAHGAWVTRCLYDSLYPAVLPKSEFPEHAREADDKDGSFPLAKVWVPQGGFLPLAQIARQTIEFPPYLVRAPGEWREKVPALWTRIKDTFTAHDCADALRILNADQKCLSSAASADGAEVPISPLTADKLEIAVRLVMAITDMLQHDREAGKAGFGGLEELNILMPTSDGTLKPVQECVFNNMTWLPDVETAEVSLGSFCLVHPKISHAVAHTCGCRGLSLVYAREATEMAGADWFEAAGQSEPMTTRLKNLLKDYPADISIFKEMTQNADDAGATKVHFVWDWRQFRKQSLLTPDMDRWQGPCLWVFNDASFSNRDFESICRLGVGGKREASRKIGRFGLGFNSAYNLTDLPSILSDDVVLFLDPHVRHLQAMGASVQKPGIKLRFLKINVLEKFRDQFEPYHGMLGCDLSSQDPFAGTLMRIPFRTPEVAKNSEISNIVVDQAIAEALCGQFQAEAFQWLLFLQSVVEIELSEIPEGSSSSRPELRSIARVRLQDSSPGSGDLRPAIAQPQELDTSETSERTPQAVDHPPPPPQPRGGRPALSAFSGDDKSLLLANITIQSDMNAGSRTHHYRLVGGLARALDEQVCIAVPLKQLAEAAASPGTATDAQKPKSNGSPAPMALASEEGRLFCFLPLPRTAVSLKLAVHVHAPLNTAQDRRSVLLDDRIGARDLIQHNLKLLDQHIPQCLFRCLMDLAGQTSAQDLFRAFPVLSNPGSQDNSSGESGGVAERVAHAFYKLLIKRSDRLFPVVTPGLAADAVADLRVAFREAVFFSSREAAYVAGPEGNTLIKDVSISLARFGVPVVEVPSRILESLERVLHPAQPRVLTPLWVRQFLRAISTIPSADDQGKSPSFSIRENPEADDTAESTARGTGAAVQVNYLTIREAGALLEFALADNDLEDLEGVPLLVTEDPSIGTVGFSAHPKMPTIFVPEDEDEYAVLPQAPSRLISRTLKKERPRVWTQLRHMASGGSPHQEARGVPSFQLRQVTFEPVVHALQDLLPSSWNAQVADITVEEWSKWIEVWMQAMWKWMTRNSLPMSKLMHWPLIPSLQYASKQPDDADHKTVDAQAAAAKPDQNQELLGVKLYRLVPNSILFTASDTPNETTSEAEADEDKEIDAWPNSQVKAILSDVLEKRLGAVPIRAPSWLLRDYKRLVQGFIHAGSPEGLLKVVHMCVRPRDRGKGEDPAAQMRASLAKLRQAVSTPALTPDQLSAVATWFGLAQREGCTCQTAAIPGWKRVCQVVQTVPLFCPFSQPDHRVSLADFEKSQPSQGARAAAGEGGSPGAAPPPPPPQEGWAMLPETCPEVAAALRAAGVKLPTVIEVPTPLLASASSGSNALLNDAIKSLMQELSLPRLSWSEVMLCNVFPWASGEADAGSRQGLMLAVVRRWKEMELAGHDQCVEVLQHVPFVSTVGGQMLSPSQLLDPGVEELRHLYGSDGTAGPFPAQEAFAVLSSAAQNGLLRFRREISLEELVERLTFLHKQSAAPPASDNVRNIAESLLQYVADHVAERCSAPADGTTNEEVTQYSGTGDTGLERSASRASAFLFAMSSPLMRGIVATGIAGPESQERRIVWSEDEIEILKSKVRSCDWLPAAQPPREWLKSVPWTGSSPCLWRADKMRLMPEFWTCGAAAPLLCLETQLGVSGDRRARVQRLLLDLLGLPDRMEASERCQLAWAQLDAVRAWWRGASPEEREEQGAVSWVTNCLYMHVYPHLNPRPPPPPTPPPQTSPADAPVQEVDPARAKETAPTFRTLTELFIDVGSDFIDMDDISVEQGFPTAGLYQMPASLRSAAAISRTVKHSFNSKDCCRGLERLRIKMAENQRPQLNANEVDTAVRLSITLADRVRTHDEELPETLLVPTSRGTLRPAQECVFNNMKWLSPEEQQKRSAAVTARGLDWVHASVSNEVASTLHVRGLNAQVAAEAMGLGGENGDDESSWFEAAGQAEPLTTRLRLLLRDMNEGADVLNLNIFKELLQNADDAQATEVHFVWDWRRFGTQSLMSPEMARWQGPCLWVHNDASFSAQDFENITKLGSMQKMASRGRSRSVSQIGRFGLGFNSVYDFTDLPSILSHETVLFLDPHVRHLRGMGANAQKPGMKLHFLRIDVLDKFRDQFEPYQGLFGCDLRVPFQGTLIRLPFRTPEAAKTSEMSNFVMTAAKAAEKLKAFRAAAAECLIFLQHVKTIRFCWIPQDAGARAQPTPVVEVRIEPPGSNGSDPDVARTTPDASPATSTVSPSTANPFPAPDPSTNPFSGAASTVASALTLSTDQQALECRKLFSSRTTMQSRERRSLLTSILGSLGFSLNSVTYSALPTDATEVVAEEPRPFAVFNLAVTLRWNSLPSFAWPDSRSGERTDIWRLFLRHEDADGLGWVSGQQLESGASGDADATAPGAEPSTAGDFVPFAGLALCLTRPLQPDEPRISCFLPLPVKSSLPFLVNANFVLSDPTSPRRLDLIAAAPGATDSISKGAAWNRLLLDKLVGPMIRACLEEQARGLHAASLQQSGGSAGSELPCASWVRSSGGICTLMPVKAQLPESLQELLDLSALYASLQDVVLFPSLSAISPVADATTSQASVHRQLSMHELPPLLSFASSVQPLSKDLATESQRQAVHEYLYSACGYKLCDVQPTVAAEFVSAGVERHAVISQSLLVEQLQAGSTGRKPRDAKIAAALLTYLLAGDAEDPAGALRGLPLAPLCDGTVATLGNADGGQRMWCAFPGGSAGDAARSAQQVLEQLSPRSAIDLTLIGTQGAQMLRRYADPLGILDVNSCTRLAEALKEAVPSMCSNSRGGLSGAAAAAAAGVPGTALGNLAKGVMFATAFVGGLLGNGASFTESASANALGLGNADQARTTICELWYFVERAPEGLGSEFLESFKDFFIIPACDAERVLMPARPPPPPPPPPAAGSGAAPPPPPPPPQSTSGSADSASSSSGGVMDILHLLPLSADRPLLLPPPSDSFASGLLGPVARILPDRFVDTAHPALSSAAVRFLGDSGVARQFGAHAVLAVLAAATGPPGNEPDVQTTAYRAVVARCASLSSSQRDQLCTELSAALHAMATQARPNPGGSSADSLNRFVAALCSLPIFVSEAGQLRRREGAANSDATSQDSGSTSAPSGGRGAADQASKALTDLCVVDGEPLQLEGPRLPANLDLTGGFVFRQSPRTFPALAQALGLPEVQQYLKALNRFFTPPEWLLGYVVPHMADLADDHQAVVLERLLPDMDADQANSHAPFIPAEVEGGGALLKAPSQLLDAQDFTIQEVLGLGGGGTSVALPRHSLLHFPSKSLPSSVRNQLRRLGMRQSANDPHCLLFLIQELRNRHRELPAERYGELQRVLFQRMVESWPNLNGQAQHAILAEPFVDVSAEADGGEQPESLFSLRPYRFSCAGRLLRLSELVSRLDLVNPYLCWTSAPLCPRSFPEFDGYQKPSLDVVVAHAKVLGELADSGTVSCHMWPELREKVIAPLCEFLAASEPFRAKLASAAEHPERDVGAEAETVGAEPLGVGREAAPRDDAAITTTRNRICSQLRRTKFLAVPLEASDCGPHSLVAPWRISLVIKEHRPPMFALPAYLQEHVDLLRLLGVRDALEVPAGGGGSGGGMLSEKDASLAAETANRWLFEHGAESFSDVTVHCDGGNLFLHRNILMARSDYFRAMFQGGDAGFREGREGGAEVHLLEAPMEVAKVLFGYLYHGRVDEAPLEGAEGAYHAVELLCLADQLGVPQLFEFAQLWVANQQDLDDCATTLQLAGRHQAEMLEQATLSLMAANLDAPEVEAQLPSLSNEHREALMSMAQRSRRQ